MKAANRPALVITGGRGMLARAVRRAAEVRGYSPVALGWAECDVTSAEAVKRLFEQYRPGILINCAAYTKVDLCEKERTTADAVNGLAVGALAEAGKSHGTKLVHISTDFVFDGRAQRPYQVDDPVNPLSAYGQSKLLGEQLLQKHNPSGWLIVRTAWLYGQGGSCFPRTMVERAAAGKPLKVVADQAGAPTYTPDLAEALLNLIDRNAAGIWHLTNSGQTTWFDFARATLRAFALPPDVSPITSANWRQMYPESAIRPAYSVLDIRPYEKLAGQAMRPWPEALADYRQTVSAGGF